MKRTILIILAITLLIPTTVQAKTTKTRRATGKYYNYMTIITSDGHEWLLSDKLSRKNPYMKYSRKSRCYMPIFKNGQKVKVKFDSRGTKRKSDDRIISVKVIKRKK